MARPLRLEYPGALWHVTSRGNARGSIFSDDADRKAFLDVLAHVVEIFRWELHAYVLMGNHYHLLVATPEPNLSRGMRQVNGIYTQRFNRRHARTGHVMQGRFKGILVEKESHLLELARYVVLNPVRAGLVRTATDWPWSSYRATAGLAKEPEWMNTVETLEHFGRSTATARAAYCRFVAEGVDSAYEPWKNVRGQLVLGGETFARKVGRRVGSRRQVAEIPKRQRFVERPAIGTIIRVVAKVFGVIEETIRRPRSGSAREAVAHVARIEGAWPIADIGIELGVKSWSASHLASGGARRISGDRVFRRKVERVIDSIRTT
jgi:REP element-mobilizing transposase RayT